jgi:hypothetical protein
MCDTSFTDAWLLLYPKPQQSTCRSLLVLIKAEFSSAYAPCSKDVSGLELEFTIKTYLSVVCSLFCQSPVPCCRWEGAVTSLRNGNY